MYETTGGMGGGIVAPVTAGAVTLPLTGGNLFVQLAIAVGVGLVVWGVLNAFQRKQSVQ